MTQYIAIYTGRSFKVTQHSVNILRYHHPSLIDAFTDTHRSANILLPNHIVYTCRDTPLNQYIIAYLIDMSATIARGTLLSQYVMIKSPRRYIQGYTTQYIITHFSDISLRGSPLNQYTAKP